MEGAPQLSDREGEFGTEEGPTRGPSENSFKELPSQGSIIN